MFLLFYGLIAWNKDCLIDWIWLIHYKSSFKASLTLPLCKTAVDTDTHNIPSTTKAVMCARR